MSNLTLDDFDFDLPKDLIAQNPLAKRDSAKMLEVQNHKLTHHKFSSLADLINPNDLVITNNTKVLKSRIVASKSNQLFIFTLHKALSHNIWLAFAKKTKKLSIGDILELAKGKLEVLDIKSTGEIKLSFLEIDNVYSFLSLHGYIPLPPYIKRENINIDSDQYDYQTIFAEKIGSVAAPTASLHFTKETIQQLLAKGVTVANITLHVGAGTFLPVKTHNIESHTMHAEYGEVTQNTLDLILETKQNNGKVIAVGTTVARTLEYLAMKDLLKSGDFQGEVNLFIYPGFKFKVVDALITNFHTPMSTLLMLVSAFVGLDEIKHAYKVAIKNSYRFFSYGDCTFLHKSKYKS